MLKLKFLGGFEASLDGVALPRLRSRKGILLLAVLATNPDRDMTREQLAAAIWPESDSEAARISLRQSLSDLKRALGEESDRLQGDGNRTLRWRGDGCEVDALQLETFARSTSAHSRQLDAAIALYDGPLMDGHEEPFLIEPRERFQRAFADLLRARAICARAESDTEGEILALRRLAQLLPIEGAVHRQLMERLTEMGRSNDALEHFRQLSDTLRREWDSTPDHETTELYQALRNRVLLRHQSTAPTETDARIIGRESELVELEAHFRLLRLVTITGLGGFGKSALSEEFARRFGPSLGGPVWMTSLVNHDRGVTIQQHLRSSLSVPDGYSLAEWIGPKPGLLVIDNCELDLEPLSETVDELVQQCPRLCILCTSRVPLNLAGELAFKLGPLGTPEAEEPVELAIESPSCQLLVERIRNYSPKWSPKTAELPSIVELSRLLEGIPLAIEMAAAQARVLSLGELVRRLSENPAALRAPDQRFPERHRSLQTVLTDSYERLDEESQRCLRELSIFAGSFSLDSAEAVVQVPDPVSCVIQLLDSSFLQVAVRSEEEPRYRILEPIRQFARQLLVAAGEHPEVQARHAQYVVRLCRSSIDGMMSSSNRLWHRRMDYESENIRAALTNQISNDDFALIVSSMGVLWHIRWHTDEALHWLEAGLCRTEGVEAINLARLHYAYAVVMVQRYDFARAEHHLRESLSQAIRSGHHWSIGAAHCWLSNVFRLTGRYEIAYEHALVGLHYFEHTFEPGRANRARNTLARAADALGRFEEAEELYRTSLPHFLRVPDDREIGLVSVGLASCLTPRGRLDDARESIVIALDRFEGLSDFYRLGLAFAEAAHLTEALGDDHHAAMILGAIEGLERDHHLKIANRYRLPSAAAKDALRTRIGESAFEEASTRGRELAPDEALRLVRERLIERAT